MSATNRTVIVLSEVAGGELMVQMKDGDKFFTAVADAARACKAMEKLAGFQEQFHRLLDMLQGWVVLRRTRISTAYVTVRERDILFLVMQHEVEFDLELANDLTELDVQVANDPELSLIDLEVMSIPKVSADSAKAFLSSGPVLHYAK